MISVRLDEEKCKGCTNCIKKCPTEAIRVRRGRATIIKERCIDCGRCVLVCPHHAKVAVADPLSRMRDFKYTIALPAPSLFAQFHNLDNINIVLRALLDLGFDQVSEPAYAAQIITTLTIREMASRPRLRPIISSACPAVLRLIMQRFPELMPHVASLVAPVELAAVMAREEAVGKTGLAPKDIGIFFITPCPAKVTEAHEPSGLKEPVIDCAVSMSEVYMRLLPLMKKVKDPGPLAMAGGAGISWAATGGESKPLGDAKCAYVDGLSNVIRILEAVEDDRLPELEFLELSACINGCVGGCLTVENPFAAASRLRRLASKMPDLEPLPIPDDLAKKAVRTKSLECRPTNILDADLGKAIEKMKQAEALRARLPGLDCGSCGTPGCHALAEDVVQGYADESDCIFNMRDLMEDGDIDDSQYLPPPFRKRKEDAPDDDGR